MTNGHAGRAADQLPALKAELFKALAHPDRVRILQLLRREHRTVTELQRELGLDQSSVSQQLSVLRARRIVDGHREGRVVLYSVREPEVFVLLDAARRVFEHQLVDLQAIAAEELGSASTAG
jgi:DNA-binding transcriptional ArsR family regulator